MLNLPIFDVNELIEREKRKILRDKEYLIRKSDRSSEEIVSSSQRMLQDLENFRKQLIL